jgi:hypothetical protein
MLLLADVGMLLSDPSQDLVQKMGYGFSEVTAV